MSTLSPATATAAGRRAHYHCSTARASELVGKEAEKVFGFGHLQMSASAALAGP
jgi:hypothetical protein